MPTVPDRPAARWHLPDRPDLGWLRRRAKRLRRRAAESDPRALGLIDAYDPPVSHDPVTLARTQRVVARAFGFAGWPALRQHLRVLEEYTRSPQPAESDDVGELRPDRLLRLACLSYARSEPTDQMRAEDLLTGDPELAGASVWTLAATGRADVLADRLLTDPAAANAEGGAVPVAAVALLVLRPARRLARRTGRHRPSTAVRRRGP